MAFGMTAKKVTMVTVKKVMMVIIEKMAMMMMKKVTIVTMVLEITIHIVAACSMVLTIALRFKVY